VHVIKAYGGMEVSFHPLLTSAPHGGKWSASHAGRFIPGQESVLRVELEDGGAQSRSGWFTIDGYLLCLPEIKPRFLGRPAHSLNITPTTNSK
jgi:hypothetical protein